MIEVIIDIPVPGDPEDPAQYDFTLLDQQVSAILNSGAEPVIHLIPPRVKPSDSGKFASYAKNIARHLTQGWGNGNTFEVKIFRFGNEPELSIFWSGTREEFFQTYEVWAKAMKEVSSSFILEAPGFVSPFGQDHFSSAGEMKDLNDWVSDFLDYCTSHDVPVDIVTFHTYSPIPRTFYEGTAMMRKELEKYPSLSPLYGTPRLGNDEWSFMTGDLWSGSYHSQFDSAWAAAHNIGSLIHMIDQGASLSIRYGGPFNGTQGDGHDFLLTDGYGNGKPAYYAFEGFNWLAGKVRLSSSGGDTMNFSTLAGHDAQQLVVVMASFDVKTYLEKYEPAGSQAWKEYSLYASKYGTPAVCQRFNLTFRNLPWSSSRQVVYEHYAVDDTKKLELVEAEEVEGSGTLSFSAAMNAPSVHIVKLHAR
ncbi:MAG: hypothetical protein RDV48_31510 [Candidatus Eremiobacteraeota bacterium]|nr:hypothetical protein [Candidatus Eremiobacteraeota bacterium]